MKTMNTESDARTMRGQYRERRSGVQRRVILGRRKMVRFDETGGDRRSGYARRSTDLGFREDES